MPDYLQLFFSRGISDTSPAVVTPATANTYFSWTSADDINASLDWSTFKLENSGNMITVELQAGVSDVFGPGSDTIMITDGSGIVDLAPTPNRCIIEQDVIIKSQ